jgi:hypothetical protein
MSTHSRVDEAGELQRRWWRFSLRELLLAMLTVGAFSGWGVLLYQRFQRFEPTRFYLEHLDWQQQSMVAALRDIGEEGSIDSADTMTQIGGPSAVQSTTAYRFPLSTAHDGAFIQAFEARISKRLMETGCQMRSFAGSDSGSNQALILGYRTQAIAGAIDVCFVPSDGNHARLIIMVHEQRATSGDVNVEATAHVRLNQ